jgi:hypothetical protein
LCGRRLLALPRAPAPRPRRAARPPRAAAPPSSAPPPGGEKSLGLSGREAELRDGKARTHARTHTRAHSHKA